MSPFKNPDSRRTWGIFMQDEDGNWHADFLAHDEEVTELEELAAGTNQGFISVYLPDHVKIKPFRWAGEIISGTLRPEDLVPRFLDVLADLDVSKHNEITQDEVSAAIIFALQHGQVEYINPDLLGQLMEELTDALDKASPDNYTFGGHEGDPACIGFWVDDEGDESGAVE